MLGSVFSSSLMGNLLGKFLGVKEEEEAFVEGSPPFPFDIGVIPANGRAVVDLEAEPNSVRQWLPFNAVEVINLSDENIMARVNATRRGQLLVMAGGMRGITEIPIRTVVIENSSANIIPASMVHVTVYKEGSGKVGVGVAR